MLALPRVERRQRLPAPRLRDYRSAWTTSRLDPRLLITILRIPSRGDRDGMGTGMELGQGWHRGRDEMRAGEELERGWNGGKDGMGAGIEWG